VQLAYPEAASSSIRQLAAIIIVIIIIMRWYVYGRDRQTARNGYRRTEGRKKSQKVMKKVKGKKRGKKSKEAERGDIGRCEKKSIEAQK
jgi:hypothetical protein